MPAAIPHRNAPLAGAPDNRTIGLVGAPCDVAAGTRGADLGPRALRMAGIDAALRRLGHGVRDHGDVAGPPNPGRAPVDGYRHLGETVAWCRAVRDAVATALDAGETPLLLGGDHALSIGSVAAVARHCARLGQPLCVLWLDAHADFNTAETTPSGNIHGMPVAVICGEGHRELLELGHATPMVDAGRVFQVGIRSVDAAERLQLLEHRLAVHDMRQISEYGMRAVMDEVLTAVTRLGGHLHVSLDLDFVDPGAAPGVGTPVSGGPGYRDARLCMEMIHDSGLLGSLDVVELNPALDPDNRTARLAVDLVGGLFGEHALARTG